MIVIVFVRFVGLSDTLEIGQVWFGHGLLANSQYGSVACSNYFYVLFRTSKTKLVILIAEREEMRSHLSSLPGEILKIMIAPVQHHCWSHSNHWVSLRWN